MSWNLFIQMLVFVLIFIGLIFYLVRWMDGYYDVKEEEVLGKSNVYWSDENELPMHQKWYIKRTYQNGRIKFYTKKM